MNSDIEWEGPGLKHSFLALPKPRKSHWWNFKIRRLERSYLKAVQEFDGTLIILDVHIEPNTALLVKEPPPVRIRPVPMIFK